MNGITADFNSSRVGPKKVTASDFLTALFAPYYATGHQGFMEIRLIGGRGVKSYFFGRLDTLCRRRFESQNVHTYYGILPRERREGRKDAVKWLLALWAGLGAKKFPHPQKNAPGTLFQF